MPDLRAMVPHRGTDRRSDDLTAAERVSHHIRRVTRIDGVVVSTAVLAVGAALAWWEPGTSSLHTIGLALVVLGPLALIATLTLLPPAPARDVVGDPGDELLPMLTTPTIDDRLPELALHHSVRPDRGDLPL
jgi:hypothetical protein